MDKVDRSQWFYGILYGVFYDPLEGGRRSMISALIPEGCTVLDVCCGTGRLALELAPKCEKITGVDMSARMLRFGEFLKKGSKASNVEFVHGDATRLEDSVEHTYDYAVISLALHEMPMQDRLATIRSMTRVAKRLIISDHSVPQPRTIPGYLTTLAELCFGGRSNFALYNEFNASGGIVGALEQCGLAPEKRILDAKKIREVVTAAGCSG
ncbi:Methyltransferase domain-containing protein [Desulfatibacillum alkenivorans DSM 16219]|uniref:Methyltransferase domain-containing protein n=1 Tax=Desulfatibacillum alkenivorans DSM 16219 TaxID=1121393 RepID=A0A1M6HR43_9BACT|nr:class I SAM-dependent methyltransferase [Desulfatibacillum alkenivorans]SHJ24669.1 Methyltransferase domain-containing protein [Desulfatibacillum alkenivorans DSM 16219]